MKEAKTSSPPHAGSAAQKIRAAVKPAERIMQILFLICGLIAVAFVLVISIYLIVSGLPAIREIGLFDFLFGDTWSANNDQFGILPLILTSVYGTAGAIVIGVPIGFSQRCFWRRWRRPRWRP